MIKIQNFANTILISSIFTFVSLTTTATQAKQYYKWVDRNGSTHYTTTPPPKNARSKSKINTYGYNGHTTPVTTAPAATTAPAPTTAPATANNQPVPVQNQQQSNPPVGHVPAQTENRPAPQPPVDTQKK